MTFSTYESSRSAGRPVNLYRFQYGEKLLCYTDAEQPIVFEANTFTPLPIDRTKLTSAPTLDKSKVTITTPQNSALAELYLIYPPSSVTTVIMYQGHAIDSDFKVVWTGKIVSCARKGSKAEFTCEPVSSSLRRNGLRRRYSYGCPHALYGPECRASKAAATTTVSVVAVSTARITLPPGWNLRPADKYVGGMCEWTDATGSKEIRTILRAENGGQTFLLSGPTTGLVSGSTVSMILGCNHKAGIAAQPDGDCAPLHGNILNFGGQPFIPLKSPLAFGVNQYYGG